MSATSSSTADRETPARWEMPRSGGTVYVQSDDPKHTMGLSVMASYGSFNTQVYGVRYDTGDVDQWGGTRAYLSLKTMSSDGYLSNANLERSNAFLKLIQPLNDSTEITAAANLNKLRQNPLVGATPAQLAAFGANYAYNTNPDSQGYYGYNLDVISTDYEYIGIISKVAGFTFDNKIYTYGYFHDGYNYEDVGGVLPNGATATGDVPNGTVNGANNVPGELLINNYRSIGIYSAYRTTWAPGKSRPARGSIIKPIFARCTRSISAITWPTTRT